MVSINIVPTTILYLERKFSALYSIVEKRLVLTNYDDDVLFKQLRMLFF